MKFQFKALTRFDKNYIILSIQLYPDKEVLATILGEDNSRGYNFFDRSRI